MQSVAVINQKGGVGKTTTAVNLGAALADLGKRVLLLDVDPQSNLSLHLDQQPELEAKTLTNVLVDEVPLHEAIHQTRTANLAVVPADTSLAGVEQVLANRIGRETILREAFDKMDVEFDYAFLDCPPSLGVLSANALVAADEVLIPLQTEYFALQGMAKLMEVIELVQKRLNPALKINCILPCMVDVRTNLTAEVLSEIGRHFGDILAQSRIRANVKLAESPSFGQTIFEHAPESNGAADYRDFAREFLGLPVERREADDYEGEEEADELEEEALPEQADGLDAPVPAPITPPAKLPEPVAAADPAPTATPGEASETSAELGCADGEAERTAAEGL